MYFILLLLLLQFEEEMVCLVFCIVFRLEKCALNSTKKKIVGENWRVFLASYSLKLSKRLKKRKSISYKICDKRK